MTESYSTQFGDGNLKDFRDNLFSIFVDNLSFKVDQRCLWEVFKPFGRVRDVYLSMEKSFRRSKFAFVRFETLEEAVKVAKSTHGMLVYGWNIATKVASHGWSNRRTSQARQRFLFSDKEAQFKRGGCEQVQRSSVKGQSFVDIVKGHQDKSFKQTVKEKEAEKMMKMSWECRQGEQEWLSRCAVGVLKNFAEVSKVNQRLQNAGFTFSASYLGDKSILWCLDSVAHKEAFIGNRSIWEDSFSAMVRWSESVIPQSRLVWIKCWGVPLSCWSPAFFKSLGWKIGEPLLVEEEVEKRIRVDRGRLLVLIPQSKLCLTSILVQCGPKSYVVKLEEDSTSVDFRWTENYLGLINHQNPAGLGLMHGVDFQSVQNMEVGIRPIPRNHHAGKEKSTSSQQMSKSVLIDNINYKATRKIKRIGISAKGKKQWVGKKKKKLSIGFVQNGKLNIDKRQCYVRGSEESSSSSEDSLGISFFKDSFKARGECSNSQVNRVQFLKEGEGVSSGSHKSKRISVPSISNSPDGFQKKDIGLELYVDLGLVEVSSSKLSSHNLLKPILEDVDEEENEVTQLPEMIDKETDPEELVQASVTVVEVAAEVVDSDPQVLNGSESNSEKDLVYSVGEIKQGGNQKTKGSSPHTMSSHSMRTRKAKIREDAEIEAAKVMEIGSALGLDFSEVEEEVMEVIIRREEEDVAVFDDQ